MTKVAVLVGSLRKESFSRKTARPWLNSRPNWISIFWISARSRISIRIWKPIRRRIGCRFVNASRRRTRCCS
jgi:hypothetical protein